MTSAAGSRWKFGEVISGEDKKFTYPNIWAQQTTTGPDRLVIAPRQGHIDLLVDLLEAVNPPFGLLYVLVVPRGWGIPGRYQSPQPLNSNQVLPFLNRFRHFLEEDGRHSLWIAGAVSPSSMLVYDRHNLIYAYGPLEHYKGFLHATPSKNQFQYQFLLSMFIATTRATTAMKRSFFIIAIGVFQSCATVTPNSF